MRSDWRRVLGGAGLIIAGSLGLGYGTVYLLPTAPMKIQTQPTPAVPQIAAKTADRKKSSKNQLLSGLASWYGDVFEGHPTASGEIFHKDELTACHPTLPFGTLVRVINLHNRRSVVVRITDRGLLFPHRVIDLSAGAATKLGMLRTGLTRVRLEVVAPAHG